jgi:hypothetical protein
MRNFVGYLLMVCIASATVAQTSNARPAVNQEKAQCVRVLRDVNNAEMKYRATNHHFGTLNQLISSGDLQSSSGEQFNNSSGVMRFRLFISDDASSYEAIAIHRASDETWGFFSDESGLIYQAEPLQ